MAKYDCQIRIRGRPWYQTARRIPSGYELDPAENRGFLLTIPAYLVVEEVALGFSPGASGERRKSSFLSDLERKLSDHHK